MSHSKAEIVASSDDNKETDTGRVEEKPSEVVSSNTLKTADQPTSEDAVQGTIEKTSEENRTSVSIRSSINADQKPSKETIQIETENATEDNRISVSIHPSKDLDFGQESQQPEGDQQASGDEPKETKTRSQETLKSKARSIESTAAEKASDIVDDEEGQKATVEDVISFEVTYSELLGKKSLSQDLELEEIFLLENETRPPGPSQAQVSATISVNPEVSFKARYGEVSIDKDEFGKGLIHTPSFKSIHTVKTVASSPASPTIFTASASVQEDITIDRNVYSELYNMYSDKFRVEMKKNNYYQTKMADYYKRRRIFHVLYTDPKTVEDNQKMYGKLLEELETAHDNYAREHGEGVSEIENLKNKCRFRRGELDEVFERFQKQEHEVAKEAISSKDDAAKEIATRFIDRYLKRQKHGLSFLAQIRLAYVKLHNRVTETQELLDSLDNLGPGLRVMNYQQLKNDNRTLSDKLEEKEMSLTLLRQKYQNNMQVLAHTREKVFAINKDIESFSEQLEEISGDCADVREQIAQLKGDRDELRREIQKFKDQVGLLGKPKLLRHMQMAVEEVEVKKTQLEKYMTSVKDVTEEIRLLKRKSSTILDKGSVSQESLNV